MLAGITLPEKFFEQATRSPDQQAFYYCRTRDHKWVGMTWKRYRDEVAALAQWLKQQGVKKGDRVSLLSPNRPEWMISDLAVLSIGAVSVPIYATTAPHDVNYILEHSESVLLLVDNLDRIPFLTGENALQNIVCFDKAPKRQIETYKTHVSSLSSILHDLRSSFEKPVELGANDLATIIYTSGTTGTPKGVVHTHGNIASAMYALRDILAHPPAQPDRYFSFLPLSHVAERVLVEVGSILTGSEVSFARSIDTLAEDLVRCRPTVVLCVPRLWEKIYEKINAAILIANPIKKGLFFAAKKLGGQRVIDDHVFKAKSKSWGPKISDALVGKKLREKLGFDRCRLFLTGSAPTRPEVMRFFASFGVTLREVYGLTENLCLGVLNEAEEAVIGSCGKPFPGNEMRLAADGEIQFRAPWMFKGYYKNPTATAEAIDAEDWFSTGDLGAISPDGRLRIVGRKKELLKTSGGKYIAPVPIENNLKGFPLIKEAVVVGDERKYCVALVALDEDAIRSKSVEGYKEELRNHLKKVNETLASYETVKRIGVIKEGFTVENNSLTPSMKLKRNVIAQRHGAFIEMLYKSEDAVVCEA